MRKSKIIIGVGIFLIATVLFCTMGKKIPYEKHKYFNSPEEVIEALNSGPLAAIDKDTEKILYSDILSECLSKRKRTINPDFYFSFLDVAVDNSKSQEYIDETIEFYKTLMKNMKGQKLSDKFHYMFLRGTCTNIYDSHLNNPIDMEVILIDEGEGWVIDYINIKR
ncbi:hypothetical protein [uncultured Clostridium sp.]|uniref:hypothetical protein n=1 Tax=uncultured Clostridium sp. TaxID=59620 RepID=UPI0025CFD2DF|nr:hypothetical protein [uncultured Clostridium sp.]